MKTIAEIAQKENIAHLPAQQLSVRNIDEFAMQNINEIFKELCAILPAWRHHLRTAEEFKATRASFAKGMMENGIVSMTQVQRGLVKARQQESDFFPSVGKFCCWCKDDSWQEAFKRMIYREPVQSMAEKKARQQTSWAIRNQLKLQAAERKFKVAFEKYQGLEQRGLLTDLVQLPMRSCVTEFDKQRNSTIVRPEQFRNDSVFARVAAKGASHD